ncbi:16S rRNA pseudouridine(516) synthase RsuA [Vibrio sp. V27_P1S3P104]|uniref:16S rRNA pseudouridine(516) synthase RsuA n=1 Tax=unclassified Vibrio TaxID=2614977 RepID=UPI00137355B5|nr:MULTISPECIES: 16S rRNA pseudouridine(516) synthase RsuA [unclassified Vibrio]NAW68625.1 16S rRNA pseudouridine(516) synthase RsuA [Vibrio sp. V28_P6S34P95]NAX04527.1 16S rRNA pseudouridine(516) synthase RsuA [Vibrio sp. V30_P3S12P165]NAX34137.1 16S rRNA pseudouridine(516) synthase RsuA [Vibrio sp. V29_P1S30P107]NAX36780.1 16S rRNA pseudouridine(516) synthase RsuA [Vibrio sp. V27_P1S3P104]
MRLDKFLCDALGTTRKESTSLLKSGEVTVDDIVQKSGSFKVKSDACVEWQGRSICLTGPRYIMLYKPQGYVCSHEDSFNQTAFVLLDEANLRDLHFAGRLDADTTGLVLITDDGQWSHRITSPKHHCEKTYRVWLVDPVEPDYAEQFALGLELRNERELTRPAQLEIIDQTQVLLTIHEGKYHQVKRMFAALGNKVIGLHRERVGDIILDDKLEPGEYRRLTEQEIASVWQ